MKTRLPRKLHVILAIVALMILPFARVSPVTADPDPDAPELLLTELVVTPTEGEFVEIHNPTGATIGLSDVYLTDATYAGGDTYYYNIVTGSNAGGGGFYDFHARFPDGATIAADEYQTIALNGSDNFFSEYGIDPTYELYEDAESADGIPDMREALSGSIDDESGLSNGAEVVILYYWDGETDLVTDLDYALWGDKDEAVDKTGVSIDGPDADATDSSYLDDTPIASQDIIAGGAHASGNSWQRDDLTEGAETETGGNGVSGDDETSEDLSNTWCDSPATPGEESVCEEEVETGECGDPGTLISEVQGDGFATPLEAQQVVIEGIVVGDFQWGGDDDGDLGGFHVQEEDEDADGDPLTSEGVFVYDGSFGVDVEVGDRVRVNGVPTEYWGLTQIGSLSDVLVCDSGNTVTPVDLTLPLDSVDELERYEGMSVDLDQPLVISEFYNFDRYGEIVLTIDRQFQPTAIYEPDAPEREQLAEQNMLNRVQLEDGFSASNVDPARHPDGDEFTLEHRFRGGDLIQNISGVMSYGYGSYEIQPTAGADYTAVNERPAEPDDVGGDITAAAFNVLNYFTTLDAGEEICGPDGDMDCRGANTADEFTRQQAKIVEAMCAIDADVFGLVELENQNPDNDPEPGDGIEDYVLNNLTAALNDADSPCPEKIYTFTDSGAAGTDAIRQGIIYKSGVLTPTGRAVLTHTAFTDPNDLGQQKNRPAVAETFEDANGESFTVVVNHLKSKGSDCGGAPDDDPVQGNCNGTRTKAADYLGDWLATDPTGSGDPDFLILGDLNAYDKEDPIDELVNDGYTDLVADYQGEYAYSYVFDGQLGYLDYGMANEDLLPQVTGATVWHINSDEPDILDYDMTYKKPAQDALYQENPYRSSDHDPVIVGLELTPPTFEVFLPLVARRWPPIPYQPTIDPISNPDGDGSYNVTWTENPSRLADEYTLQEATNSGFTSDVRQVCRTSSQICHVSGRSAGTYYYRVQGHNSWGDGQCSAVRSVQVLPPAVPWLKGIDNPNSGGSYTVSWAAAARANNYVLQEATNPDFTGASKAYEGPNLSWDATGKNEGTYYYRVRAWGPTGHSEWSVTRTVNVLPPAVPSLKAINNPDGDGYYTVSWGTAARATNYVLQEATNPDFTGATKAYEGPNLSWDATGNNVGTYHYRVRAWGPTGTSGWSNTRSVSVVPPPLPGDNEVCKDFGQVQLCASVSDGTPSQYATVTVYGRYLVNGAGEAGHTMNTSWHYKTTTSHCSGTTGADGIANCSRRIGRATKGYRVNVDVEIGGHKVTTWFTPQ